MPAPKTMRQHLIDQGVTDEVALRKHITFAYQMMKHCYPIRVLQMRYRVNPDNPNSFPPMMG